MARLADPIPAATLIVMRGQTVGPPKILMIQRSAELAFAGGAMVFPGGRIDPHDHHLAARSHLPDAAARIAAIRETIEEAGLGIGLDPPPGRAALARLRIGIEQGLPFGRLLTNEGLALNLESLTPFARWLPDIPGPRRFDTYFFLAEASEGEVRADGGEAVRAQWMTAGEVLDEVAKGDCHAIYPTRRNLERLARFDSFQEAVADTVAYPQETITPWIEERAGAPHLCIPDRLGYPVTAEPVETSERG